MRVTPPLVVAALAAALTACSDVAPTAAPIETQPLVALADARPEEGPDLMGTPDLIVDARLLSRSWEFGDEFFEASSCDVIEGDMTPGAHRTLRFTVATPNIGTADLYVGDPNEHFDPNGDGDPSDGDGLFEFAECHEHLHFRNYATYELYPVLADGSLGTPINAAKRGFCMIDSRRFSGGSGKAFYRTCGAPARGGVPAVPGNQGISVGWSDIYDKALPGQLFVVDDLAPGEYVIRIVANPPFVAQSGDVCPHTDSLGLCHMFEELDYTNNVAEARVTIPVPRN